jgi:plasmid stabilization system protein ParE
MYRVLIRETAYEGLEEIVAYIGRDNPDAAEKLGHELLDQALSLRALPFRGSAVRKRPNLLELVCGNYLIYYRVKEDERLVEILQFVHGARIK